MKKEIKNRLPSLIVLTIVFIVSTTFFIRENSIKSHGNAAIAYIYDVNRGVKNSLVQAAVEYKIGDEQYKSTLSAFSFTEGKYITIYYNENNYEDITADASIRSLGVFSLMVGIWLSIEIINLKKKLNKKNKQK